MRRSICYVEPSVALAGEVGTWELVYSPVVNLAKGARLKLDLCSDGRDVDWEEPQVNQKAPSNVIYAYLKNGAVIKPKKLNTTDRWVSNFEFVLPTPVKAGGKFTIVMGTPKGKKRSSKNGNRCQTLAQRRKQFHLYVDPKGTKKYGEPEIFNIDVKGNELDFIRIISPSIIPKNKRFDVTLLFEDHYGNLTQKAPEGTLIELSHELQRENLKWQIFVPETGFITLPNMYFTEDGVYRLKLLNLKTKQKFLSAPILCTQDDCPEISWGLLHGESEKFNSTESIEECVRSFRDQESLHFFASSNFENDRDLDEESWKLISQNIAEFNEKEHFTTFLGFQWIGKTPEEGLRHIIYTKDNLPVLKKKDAKNNSLKKIYKNFQPNEILSIPSFTMAKGFAYDFKKFNPEFERVVEIYNSWGSSEISKKEGNNLPISSSRKNGVKESIAGSVQQALQNNCRFGFVAGGADYRNIYEDLYEKDQTEYNSGLTAILTKNNSREQLLEAIYNRQCYATTGERIILRFFIAGEPMGKEISSKDKPGLLVNRHISGLIAGTDELKTVEIIRNGKVIQTFRPKDFTFDFAYDDMTPLQNVSLKKSKQPFSYYYLRITQKNGHMAWSSPIWVDLVKPGK